MVSKSGRKIFLGMPGYGNQSAAAGRAFWRASADMDSVYAQYQCGSLLAQNFNTLWCAALNVVHRGGQVDYFAMLHDDIGAEDFWLDALIEELEANELDVLGVAVPIKDRRGLTSLAVHREGDNWRPECRLTMRELQQLPRTFTSEDLGGKKLLLNTGCWICRFDPAWVTQVHFEINDKIAFNTAMNCYQAVNESEDWYFSRLCHEIGLRIGATRKIHVDHRGDINFSNHDMWGEEFDSTSVSKSIVPTVDRDGFRFPADVDGWLDFDEGKELWRLCSGRRVLEIGSYCGRSSICIAQSAKKLVAVDPHDGRGTFAPRQTRSEMVSNLRHYSVRDKVEIHLDTSDVVGPFDVVFIDGAHDYESVRADIEHALTVLAPGGLLAFHDYRSPIDPGVTRAVDECLSTGAELLSLNVTLAVVRPAAEILSTMEI